MHVCTDETCPKTGGYYVTLIKDGKPYFMAGPYQTHALALADVDKAVGIANDMDPWVHFMPFGTVRIEGETRLGKLNQLGKI